MSTREFDVTGGSIPGVPGVNLLGFNRNIAWSTVNARGDACQDFDQFRQTLSLMTTPTLSFGYADVRGNIGHQFVMSVPLREKGDGTIPVPGYSGEYSWSGFVPFEELSYDFNPGRWVAEMVNPYIVYQPDMLQANIVDESNHFLFDDQRMPDVIERMEDMIRINMFDAVDDLSMLLDRNPAKWQWGNLHTMTFKHPLGEQFSFFNLKPILLPGDGSTINAGLMKSP